MPRVESEQEIDIIDIYFNDERAQPLELHEEVAIGYVMIAGKEAQEKLNNLNGEAPDDLTELTQAVEDGKAAEQLLIVSNRGFVVETAKQYMDQGVPFPDLIQEGNIGLMNAVSRYDPTRNRKVITYASHYIRRAIIRAIENENNHDQSLDAPASDREKSSTILEFTPSRDLNPEDEVIRNQRDKLIKRLLASLSKRQRTVLKWRYGFMDGEDHPFREVAEEIGGITGERARQNYKTAMKRLRKPSKKLLIEEYRNE